ncbi:MAG TPA: polyhydroxyalkanoate depolymerase, partial [Enterovirga sp.]
MLYEAYERHSDLADRMRSWGHLVQETLAPWAAVNRNEGLAHGLAAAAMMVRAGLTHARPSYGLETVPVGNRDATVVEETALSTPFGTLTRFRKDVATAQPRVLVVAP